MNKTELIDLAVKASIAGGIRILEIYEETTIDVVSKDDDSPLTKADLASNESINGFLEGSGIPILSEENKQDDYQDRQSWEQCWIVDPLDGTKEFIKRNGEFTVNIALVSGATPILGVIYVPVTRELYVGDVSGGASYKQTLNADHSLSGPLFVEENKISPLTQIGERIQVVGSRSHMNDATKNFIEDLSRKHNNKEVEVVSKGSSLKFCLVAEGKAHMYPRFAPTMEWDTAAGQAICKAVGLRVTSMETQLELEYNKENLLNSYFLVEGNAQ
ncbi:MAG: 3'(2'),5'-bisphosphate nucleotidase CysQ [Flavobacteriaceae bacterium]|nr:3'(2'),5'-bisphosphate nucleotidase CysQ [Flavobacteriaceae bacterium]